MTQEEDIRALQIDVALVKRDISNVERICDKLDMTTDKIRELIDSIGKMIPLHEQRISQQEENDREIVRQMEIRRKEADTSNRELHDRITKVDDELSRKIEDSKKEVLNKIDVLIKSLKEEPERRTLIDRVKNIELFKYGIIGVAATIGWLVSHIDFTKMIDVFK
jgi:hypothetical protein